MPLWALVLGFGCLVSVAGSPAVARVQRPPARNVSAPSGGATPTTVRKVFPPARKVFWKGSLTFKVPSYDQARDQAVSIALKHGGNYYSAKTNVTGAGRKHGMIVLRVPEGKRDDFLSDIRSLGVLYQERIDAPDLTEEFVDLDRRLRNLRAEEDQLIAILGKARHVLEVLQVQSHLFSVRVEIERSTSRQSEIDLKSQTSLFVIGLFEPPHLAAPVNAGGAAQFLPRWWEGTAWPQIKREASKSYREVTEKLFTFILGTTGGLPNALYLALGLLIAWLFARKALPTWWSRLQEASAEINGSDLSVSAILWTTIFLYAFHRFFSSEWLLVAVSGMLVLWWRGFKRTGRGMRMRESVAVTILPPWAPEAMVSAPFVYLLASVLLGSVLWDFLKIAGWSALVIATAVGMQLLVAWWVVLRGQRQPAEAVQGAGGRGGTSFADPFGWLRRASSPSPGGHPGGHQDTPSVEGQCPVVTGPRGDAIAPPERGSHGSEGD